MSITPLPPADFTPTITGYTKQGAFRFWCQTVLPIVYDDSLSYYELLNKVVNYLNNTISDVASLENNINGLYNSYNDLQDYVNNYFSSLDVQYEIDNKLDQMAESGQLTELFGMYFITPEMFGAKGDYSEVDTIPFNQAILKAVEKGVPLYLTGKYLVDYNSPIVFNDINGLTIVGKNAEIKLKDQTAFYEIGTYYLFDIERCENIEISGITFNGNRNNLSISDPGKIKNNHLADGIFIRDSEDIYIHDCKFIDILFFGIYCMSHGSISYNEPNISRLKIINNYFNACMNATKILEGISNTIYFCDNVCMNMDTHGISFYPTATNVIVKNNVIECGVQDIVTVSGSSAESGVGIRLYETNNVVVDGNTILTSYKEGIVLEHRSSIATKEKNITIINNKILESRDGLGIYLKSGENIIIKNNTLSNIHYAGIYVVGSNVNISDNQLNNILATGSHCIYINCPDNGIVKNNVVIDGYNTGIISTNDDAQNIIIEDNILLAKESFNFGLNLRAGCKVGFNAVNSWLTNKYYQYNESVKFLTPKIIHNCTFDVKTVAESTYTVYGLVDNMKSLVIQQDCYLVGLVACVNDDTTAGVLKLRIFKNGDRLTNAKLDVDLSTVSQKTELFLKGRNSPESNFAFAIGDVLTVAAFKDGDYLPGNTTAAMDLIFDCDR